MSLPSAIEAALTEAGFSGSELSILKRLLEDDALTLRELALKTGKSTGVLDQAMKKLLKKEIMVKQDINGVPKYTLGSMKAIAEWVERDTREKQILLQRRHENVEAFIASIEHQKERPEMQYFHGKDGLKQAYILLLSQTNQEILHYLSDDRRDPEEWREFMVQFFRLRRQKGIYSRVVTHNDPLGRRFQSRDPFEFRGTFLVHPSLPIPFEKIIAGNVVACFDHEKIAATFIHYPALAESERANFEHLWATNTSQPVQQPPIPEPVIPTKTRILSSLRSFFLSKASIYSMVIFAFLALAATYGLYQYNVYLVTQRLREKVMSIAATGALQFDAAQLDQLRELEDVKNPTYSTVVHRLIDIRKSNEKIQYAYLIRPRENSTVFEFIADADGYAPLEEMDVNEDGEIDLKDEVGWPGRQYEVSHIDVLKSGKFKNPTATSSVYTDQWGSALTGYAPILDEQQNIHGLLAIDMDASEIGNTSRSTFAPIRMWYSKEGSGENIRQTLQGKQCPQCR